ncbi:MAG: hypothetical protein A2W19_16540 [Spirochaetes bacterium RBG_16_49_21]|nr:MAG: hypothetical protein A2W19_16540 [Spirochaetes bacterium RBG_16_49_21]
MNLYKIVYCLWPPEGLDKEKTRDILLHDIAPRLITAGAARLSMDIGDPESAMRSPAPKLYRDRPICGLINLWLADIEKRTRMEDMLKQAGFRIAGYLVEESVFTDYGGNRHSGPRDWPDGRRSPGVVAVTLMERPRRIPREEWIRRWHGTMSPLSESIQPRTRYVRNVVLKALTAGAPPFEGIVEEVWPSKRHVSNYFLFYGADNIFQLVRNMLRILRAVKSFLDMRRIRTTIMSEYFIKTK